MSRYKAAVAARFTGCATVESDSRRGELENGNGVCCRQRSRPPILGASRGSAWHTLLSSSTPSLGSPTAQYVAAPQSRERLGATSATAHGGYHFRLSAETNFGR